MVEEFRDHFAGKASGKYRVVMDRSGSKVTRDEQVVRFFGARLLLFEGK